MLRINSITSLRGIFILFIFFHHAGIYEGGGTMAVAFFFVLSGYSMTLGYKDRVHLSDFNYKHYLLCRCIKFYPLHWITLFADIPLVLMSTLHWWLIPLFIVNAALLQVYIPLKEIYFSYNAVSWFLADILFFAVFFPFVLRILLKRTMRERLFILLVLLIFYGIGFLAIPDSLRHGIFYINPFVRIFDFLVGICLSLFYMKIRKKSELKNVIIVNNKFVLHVLVCFLITLLVVESFILSPHMRLFAPLYWPLIAILILLVSIPQNRCLNYLENKYLIRLGESSFTIFLVHRLVLRYTSKLLVIDNTKIYILFCLTLTIILSFLVERFILNPINQWITKNKKLSMTARS